MKSRLCIAQVIILIMVFVLAIFSAKVGLIVRRYFALNFALNFLFICLFVFRFTTTVFIVKKPLTPPLRIHCVSIVRAIGVTAFWFTAACVQMINVSLVLF